MSTFNRTILFFVLGCALVSFATAQSSNGDRLSVTLSDPSRPAYVKADLMNGSITVKGYAGTDVIVEATTRDGDDHDEWDEDDDDDKSASRRKGMRKITSNSSSISVEEDNNEVTVSTGWRGMSKTLDIVIQVPASSSLKLSAMNDGDITVNGVKGDIEVSNLNGPITLKDVSGSVVADALNDDIEVTLTGLDPKKTSSFSSLNGDIDVTIPASGKATMKLKSDMGDIYSDFEMKMDSKTSTVEESPKGKKGKYKVTVEKVMTGTINGGGAEMTFKNFNGNIYIRKGK